MMIEANPLHWPAGKPRTSPDDRQHARFNKGDRHSRKRDITYHEATTSLKDELSRLGVDKHILSSNLSLRLDGMPYANQKRPDDPGIAVYFKKDGKELCFACDKWVRPEDNIRAIAKSIEAIRGLERWGSKDMVDAAFRGFMALPAPEDVIIPVVEYFHGCQTIKDVRHRYWSLAKTMHPDVGGNSAEWSEMNRQHKVALSRFIKPDN